MSMHGCAHAHFVHACHIHGCLQHKLGLELMHAFPSGLAACMRCAVCKVMGMEG